MDTNISPTDGTYLGALIEIINKTTGPVLECGMSIFSTPYLHFACSSAKRKIISYDNSLVQYNKWKAFENDYHKINFIDDWDKIDISGHWSVALIDHEPKISRKDVIKRLSLSTDYIIAHDTQGRLENRYRYSEVFPLFKHRKDFTSERPFTTVLSNFIDLSKPDTKNQTTNLTTIIFSKNRACQLELLLRSLNIPVIVQYTYDADFKAGYDKVIEMYPSVKFVRENNFREQLIELVSSGLENVMFLVDDDVMIRPFSENSKEFEEFRRNHNILCLSLRQSPSYRYGTLPELIDNKWDWRPYSRQSKTFNYRLRTWGCPMAVGAHIFRRSDILSILRKVKDIKTPSYLERELTYNAPDRPFALCFDKAKFVNVEANQVQTDFRSHTYGLSIEELEKQFVQGKRLSLTNIIQGAENVNDYFMQISYDWE